MKRLFAMTLVICLLASSLSLTAYADDSQKAAAAQGNEQSEGISEQSDYELTSYKEYLEKNSNVAKGEQEYVIDSSMITSKTKDVELRKNYNGFKGTAIYTTETDSVEFEFDAKAGMYNLYMEYYTEKGKNISIERAIYVNGKIPFSVAGSCSFTRSWRDDIDRDENGNSVFDTDIYGNNITPDQVENYKWTSSYFYDYLGYYTEPLNFCFKDGKNTITLKSVKEPMTIGLIKLVPSHEVQSYAEYKADCEKNGYADYSGDEIIIEAEHATEKSDQTLYPVSDVSTPSTSASGEKPSAYIMKINEIGGSNWQYAQQSIGWTVGKDVKPGLYSINFKVRKNQYQGMISSRKLYINGEVPFKEVEAIGFTYSTEWTMVSPKTDDGEQCLIYLEPGDVISLESTLGSMGPIIRDAESALAEVNKIYRSILMITGSSPDKYRDYLLDKLIPDVIDDMKVQADMLESIVTRIVEFTGQKGSDLSSLDTLSRQLNKMYNDPDCISKQLNYFKTNIGSFGTWMNTASNVPIELDYISLSAPKAKIAKPTKGFFENTWYEINRFVASFVVDYNAIGSLVKTTKNDKTVTVWIVTGRDQFQSLRTLINNSYTASTGNQVNLELVSAGALLSAVVAGIGPDVVLGQAKNEPVNFALRNAVYNLSNFDDVDEIKQRFSAEALVPYYFNDGKSTGLYALPETQDFHMLFYRKDVLKDLGLSIPNTWNEVISCITVLNKNNMEFGLPVDVAVFNSLLLQNGGKIFSDDYKSTELQTTEATKAFKQWTNYYVNYGLQLEFDFQNRFRTGEMPLGIANYTLYNTLSVAAPEIRGLWGFTSIPGIEQEDGSINRSNTLTTSSCFILKDNVNPKLSWEFLKWWTAADTQSAYGNRLECILGASARYNTANIKAFESLPWSASEIAEINGQLKTCHSIPEMAGSYFLARHITNAFRRVKYKTQDAKDTLYDYSNVINSEITNKRSEFGLPTLED